MEEIKMKTTKKKSNSSRVPPPSKHALGTYKPYREGKPSTKIRENWGPVFRLKLPNNGSNTKAFADAKKQKTPWADISSVTDDEILSPTTDLPLQNDCSSATLGVTNKEDLTPCERIGVYYSDSPTALSPRTLAESNSQSHPEQRLSSPRPGRRLLRTANYKQKNVRPPTSRPSSRPPAPQSIPKSVVLKTDLSREFFEKLNLQDIVLDLDESELPLELFDDDEQELLDAYLIERTKGEENMPGRSRKFSSATKTWVWKECYVLQYSESCNKFEIKFKGEQKTKLVRRFSLVFDCESLHQFENRVSRCISRREVYKGISRFYTVLNTWSSHIPDCSPVGPDWLENILKRAILIDSAEKAQEFLSENSRKLRGLLKEVKTEYTLAMRHGVLQYFARDPWLRGQLASNRLPYIPGSSQRFRTHGMQNTTNNAIADMTYSKRSINQKHWTKNAKTRATVKWVHELWFCSFDQCLFFDVTMAEHISDLFPQLFPCTRGGMLTSLPKAKYRVQECLTTPCDLREFDKLQETHAENLNHLLNSTWRRTVIDYIQDHLHSTCHFYERDMTKYETTLLCQLIRKLHLLMRQQIRSLVSRSIKAWLSLIEQFSNDMGNSSSTLVGLFQSRSIQREEERGNARCFTSLWDNVEGKIQRRLPLFKVQLDVDPSGAIVFSPSEDELRNVFSRGLDRIENTIKSLGRLEVDLLPLLFTKREPLICAETNDNEYLDAEVILQARRRIDELLDKCLEAPRALAQLYGEFSPILEIKTDVYAEELQERAEALHECVFQQFEEEDRNKKKRTKTPHETIADEAHKVYIEKLIEMQNQEVLNFISVSKEVEYKSHDWEMLGLVRVDCSKVKGLISSAAKNIAGSIMDAIVTDARVESTEISTTYKQMLEKMSQVPENEAELIRLREYIVQSDEVVRKIEGKCLDIQSRLKILERFSHPIPDVADFGVIWGTWLWPRRVKAAAREALSALGRLKTEMMDKLKKEQLEFEENLKVFSDQVESFVGYHNLQETEQYAEEASQLNDRLEDATRKANDFAQREEMFGWFPTEYPSLAQIKKAFDPFFRLWSTVSDFAYKKRVWLGGPFLELEAQTIENLVVSWYKDTRKLQVYFEGEGQEAPLDVARYIHKGIEEFKEKLPLIQSLASPALRKRHWGKFSLLLQEKGSLEDGETIEPDEELALQHLLDLNVEKFVDEISSIREVAEKEYSLERALDSMMLEWEEANTTTEKDSAISGVQYNIVRYKESGTFIVRETDEIVTMLDDQITKVQTMRGSPYIAPIENRAQDWERKLNYTQKLLDEWLALQRTWLYLFPIFMSDDIKQQLPREARMFASVDLLWRKSMETIEANPGVMEVSDIGLTSSSPGVNTGNGSKPSKERGLMFSFREANQKLELVQRGLNVYLESKRIAFPRFFFLSNDELLEILSQTKDPRAVQPHLNKSFEGIHRIEFDETEEIVAMESSEGEVVAFTESVKPNDPLVKGKVELWMSQVEKAMHSSVQDQIKKAISAYAESEREEWVISWPGQAVLCVNEIHWTAAVEQSLRDGQEQMEELYVDLSEQLEDLVQLVRGKLTKLNRKTLSALVVIDVHARDVVNELIESGIAQDSTDPISSFKWQSQLRYYYCNPVVRNPDEGGTEAAEKTTRKPNGWKRGNKRHEDEEDDKSKFSIQVRIANASQRYRFEYLGNSGRLVITPLTDRCYRTLIGAISLHYGGAPAGPAGTGKTETTKDLAKALAIQCVVFNGSDGLDYLAMGKFFKGLASSGAWACFDEFNRIDVEVLSVVAQQVATIQAAKREGVSTFNFEGTSNLRFRKSCNVFITMNPGYAGRSELPDNLALLFRPVAMMVPDYSLIAEIVLYSYGFSNTRNMARKITQVLRLCSEQLSSQDHYDYGMRSVKTILDAAGKLKQESDEEDVQVLVLRAITMVSLPKFVGTDVDLFQGIVKDLFPEISLGEVKYWGLQDQLGSACKTQKLEPKKEFLSKCLQLYDTVCLRHGLMLVGETMSGKTSVLQTLSAALQNVSYVTINPKAIQQTQLYGCFDESSHEWHDGVLAIKMREAVLELNQDTEDEERKKWIVFDGPVDAIWIENMNTVLDDNKKLCLNSGEIIRLHERITMIYEVENLAVASPATVSRCGMIFLEQKHLGWSVLVESFLSHALPKQLRFQAFFIKSLFFSLVPCGLEALSLDCISTMLPMSEMQLVQNLINIFDVSCLESFRERESDIQDDTEQLEKEEEVLKNSKNLDRYLASYFVWSIVWSFGGCLENKTSHAHFDEYIKTCMRTSKLTTTETEGGDENGGKILFNLLSLPQQDTVLFEYFPLVRKSGQDPWDCLWAKYSDYLSKLQAPENMAFSSVIVPTVDIARTMKVFKQLVENRKHVLCVGPTGTGKSVSIKQYIGEELDPGQYQNMFLQFSAQTKANATQALIDGQLERRRRGVYGPPIGKRCVIFVDDLNLVKKEIYGAQPVIELLRQWKDHKGWYDLGDKSFRQIKNVQFVAAMGPVGGGRTSITNRYLRHYNLLSLFQMDAECLRYIFSSLMTWKFGGLKNLDSIVNSTIDIYETIAMELLPTPNKSHYLYNVRDLSKVFEGFCQSEEFNVRLWAHECLRVFQDRLVSTQDKDWFVQVLAHKMEQYFSVEFGTVFSDHEASEIGDSLIFGSFEEDEAYTEQNLVDVHNTLCAKLDEFNDDSRKPMLLVLFKSAIQHVSRINRCIKKGHALLVGVGGSGRKSLTILAAYISRFDVFQMEQSQEWYDNLKGVLQTAGCCSNAGKIDTGKPVILLLSDAQTLTDPMLEDVCNLLNVGEVPSIFHDDEFMMQIGESCGNAARMSGFKNAKEYFVHRCKANLRVVLCFSPVNPLFRPRLRNFPSLINCCYIDWFSEWSTDALAAVANKFLADEFSAEEDILAGVIDVCVDMQKRVGSMTKRFLEEDGRHYYVTPTSYLELIKGFRKLLREYRLKVAEQKERFSTGLEKLLEAEISVGEMQEEITALQPVLEQATTDTEQLMVSITKQRQQADVTKQVVQEEELACNQSAEEALKIKVECEAQLAEALPALEAAMKALKTLNKNDIVEVRSMKKPPEGVKVTMEAVCIMLGYSPRKVPDPSGKGKGLVEDYWVVAQKELLADTRFLAKLVAFNKDNIDTAVIEKILPYTKLDSFTPELVKKASKAAAGLCKWVHALVMYDRVVKIVAPRRAALLKANEDLECARIALNEKKKALQEVVDFLGKLVREFDEANKKKQTLKHKIEECKTKLVRSTKLTSGLASEKVRWASRKEELITQFSNIVGDVLICSGVVAYLGPFNIKYRDECVLNWITLLKEKKIPSSDANDFSVIDTLGDPVEIRKWNIDKLPNDQFSITNCIMMFKSERFPLMIDPQNQAGTFIKNYEKKLITLKHSDLSVNQLENAISFGLPLLLEDCLEVLDPMLDTVLSKQVIVKNSQRYINLGEKIIEYDPNFRLYLRTKLPNPHFEAETCVRVNLLNFVATKEGLEDQMLSITVAKEEPQLEEVRSKLIVESAANECQLKDLEAKILSLLGTSEGEILNNENLVEVLSQSKVTSSQIEQRLVTARRIQLKNSKSRESYKAVAECVSRLYFVVASLSLLDPMYQFSLEWVVNLFLNCVDQVHASTPSMMPVSTTGAAADDDEEDDTKSRFVTSINSKFSAVLYRTVCQSLFAKDKLTFSFLLCTRLMQSVGSLSQELLDMFMLGDKKLSRASKLWDWLSDKSWNDLQALNNMSLGLDLSSNEERLSTIFRSFDRCPLELIEELLPEKSDFERLCLCKILRPDKVVKGIRNLVTKHMGREFVVPPIFDLNKTFEVGNCVTPMVFVLSPGANPLRDLTELAELHNRKLRAISLGQGQGIVAENAIAEAVDSGCWILLENCHLCLSFLPKLETIVENFDILRTAPSFRLFLTSKPTPVFPVSILMNSLKVINERPRGVRANLIASCNMINLEERIAGRPVAFYKLLFSLLCFHSVLQERRKFGPLGFNKIYDFNDSDLMISIAQLELFVKQEDNIPFDALLYLTGESNYGGRVTEDYDRRLVNTMLRVFYNNDVVTDSSYCFSSSKQYYIPQDRGEFTTYIENLPLVDRPEVFNLHDNADIATAEGETASIASSMLKVTSFESQASGQDDVNSIARNLLKMLPERFDVEACREKYPVRYEESMNSLLGMELLKYNNLLDTCKTTLSNLVQALRGLLLLDEDLEQIMNAIKIGQVPALWSSVSYPSRKALLSWINDLEKRCLFFRSWVDDGKPVEFPLKSFFFVHSFMTAVLQNQSRKTKLAIDLLGFDFQIMNENLMNEIDVSEACIITDLYLDGARWDSLAHCLGEQLPKELFSPMPGINLLVDRKDCLDYDEEKYYEAPCYRTTSRQGVLSTIGHSTNYIITIRLPVIGKSSDHFVLRGTALITEVE